MFSFLDLIVPPAVIIGSLATLPFTLIWLPITGRIQDLTSHKRFQHSWFQHFWAWFGPGSKPLFAGTVNPLLAQAKGVVLDLGPGSGVWMNELGEAHKAGQITKIYGVEPNTLFHPELRRKAKAAGLEDVYEPVGALVQDLETVGVKKESIDTVITVHVLCSVGNQTEEIIRCLYEYLKPGGQWLVFEHVTSPNGLVKGWQGKDRSNIMIADDFADAARTSCEQRSMGRAVGWL